MLEVECAILTATELRESISISNDLQYGKLSTQAIWLSRMTQYGPRSYVRVDSRKGHHELSTVLGGVAEDNTAMA